MNKNFVRFGACTLLFLPVAGCGGHNDVALSGIPSARIATERQQREVRDFPQDERTVLAAAKQLLSEEGNQVVAEEPTLGFVGGLNRYEMTDGQMAGQMVLGAIFSGPANRMPVVARRDLRYTLVTTPIPAGGTRLRVVVEQREQHTGGNEAVSIVSNDATYTDFFDRLTARLASAIPART